ncbi:hypothetical protein AX17_001942 [Amanita inopinata Kibby_2008]|nr:hypothetical protein AX17_001942 [Amanita inopinata Kibby_2008]
MIATILTQSHTAAQDHGVSRNANAAGAPLPLVPRRASSMSRLNNTSYNKNLQSCPSNSSLNFVTHSYMKNLRLTRTPQSVDDSDSSSSSSSKGDNSDASTRIKHGHVEGATTPRPSEGLAKTPSVVSPLALKNDTSICTNSVSTTQPLLYAPGVSLRIAINGVRAQPQSETSQLSHLSSSINGDSVAQMRLIRKKSGQLVKPSLKSSASCSKGGLSVVTFGSSSKSEPTTPMLTKAVHFDSQLEHVKLFLAEQKPLAVSRDGSPTDDTSGTDSDFPSFIYGASDERSRVTLSVRVNNMSMTVDRFADVALECLSLSPEGTSIMGRTRLRNVAYSKWLAVRFTFDGWLTTSEVTGKYLESIDSAFDRFVFVIRLNDLLPRIEGKTLILALRYSVNGREIWDNNGGQNYIASFSRMKNPTEKSRLGDQDGSGNDFANLQSKLEKVVQCRNKSGPTRFAEHMGREYNHPSGETASILRPSTSLSSRYDFENSLRNKGRTLPVFPESNRVTLSVSASNSIPWPEKCAIIGEGPTLYTSSTLGSPRDPDTDSFLPVTRAMSNLEGAPLVIGPSIRPCRNHQRGYFDVSREVPGIKRTPPGTPFQKKLDDISPLTGARFYSFPPMDGGRGSRTCGLGMVLHGAPSSKAGDSGTASDESTPSIVTPSSSRSNTPSPSPTENAMMGMLHDGSSHSPSTNYRQFVNKFCFFTGSDNIQDYLPEHVPQTRSTSDIEGLLTGTSPRLRGYAHHMASMPTRSPSLENVAVTDSGSSTPTVPKVLTSKSTPSFLPAPHRTGVC